jgi:voltage-gated potassium channel
VFPSLRLIFSLRLVRSMFRRGNLRRFLVVALLLVLNGAVIVHLLERHVPHSDIHTLGEAVWWSLVTVTTVGCGDFYPVTAAGRITAVFIMATGLLTLAVVTAQVAANFFAQGQRQGRTRSARGSGPDQACALSGRRHGPLRAPADRRSARSPV